MQTACGPIVVLTKPMILNDIFYRSIDFSVAPMRHYAICGAGSLTT
jgi:hypothetical protein